MVFLRLLTDEVRAQCTRCLSPAHGHGQRDSAPHGLRLHWCITTIPLRNGYLNISAGGPNLEPPLYRYKPQGEEVHLYRYHVYRFLAIPRVQTPRPWSNSFANEDTTHGVQARRLRKTDGGVHASPHLACPGLPPSPSVMVAHGALGPPPPREFLHHKASDSSRTRSRSRNKQRFIGCLQDGRIPVYAQRACAGSGFSKGGRERNERDGAKEDRGLRAYRSHPPRKLSAGEDRGYSMISNLQAPGFCGVLTRPPVSRAACGGGKRPRGCTWWGWR